MDTSLHSTFRNVYWNGFDSLFIMYRRFGKNGYQVTLLDKLQQDMYFVQF